MVPGEQASNEDTKEHLYETLLSECRDTIQAVREELKAEVRTASQTTAPGWAHTSLKRPNVNSRNNS